MSIHQYAAYLAKCLHARASHEDDAEADAMESLEHVWRDLSQPEQALARKLTSAVGQNLISIESLERIGADTATSSSQRSISVINPFELPNRYRSRSRNPREFDGFEVCLAVVA